MNGILSVVWYTVSSRSNNGQINNWIFNSSDVKDIRQLCRSGWRDDVWPCCIPGLNFEVEDEFGLARGDGVVLDDGDSWGTDAAVVGDGVGVQWFGDNILGDRWGEEVVGHDDSRSGGSGGSWGDDLLFIIDTSSLGGNEQAYSSSKARVRFSKLRLNSSTINYSFRKLGSILATYDSEPTERVAQVCAGISIIVLQI